MHFLKIDDELKVWIVPITLLDYPALLDYPEVKNKATGSISFGDYGPARKEIQEAMNDFTFSTVGIFLFLWKIFEDRQYYRATSTAFYSIGRYTHKIE